MILPRLLDKNLKELCRLHPSSLMVALNLTPISTATMTISDDMDGIQPELHQFVEIFREAESLGIFRISEISSAYGEKTISLEHAITSLEDDVTEENVTLTGSLQTIFQALLNCQTVTRWELGQVKDTRDDYSIAVDRSACLQTLLEAAKQAKNCYLHFDQSASPWTINLLKLPNAITSECRISRNIEDVTVSLDDSALCTRVYSSLLPDGYLDADTIPKWGVVAKAIQLDDGEEEGVAEKNIQVATEYLEENKNPAVSIKISAIRLAEITGEQLDTFTLGGMCRVALPEMDITRDERIVSMTYSDLVSAPERVNLALSTLQQNAGIALAEIARTTRQITRTVVEQHKHITETDTKLKLHADKIEAVANEIKLKADNATVTDLGDRVTTAEITVDNQGIKLNTVETTTNDLTGQVTKLESDLTVAADGITADVSAQGETLSSLKVRVDEISSTVKDTEGNLGSLVVKSDSIRGKLEDATGKITALVEMTDEHFASLQGDIDTLDGDVKTITGSAIWQRRDNITAAVGKMYVGEDGKLHIVDGSGLVVDEGSSSMGVYTEGNLTAGVLVQKLNNGTTSTKIKADVINLEGYVSMSSMEAEFAALQDGFAMEFSTTDLRASTIALGQSLTAPKGYVSANTLMAAASITVDGHEVATQQWVDTNYQLKSGLTTKTVTVVTDVDYNTATTPPFFNAQGTQVSAGLQYVKGITKTTEEITFVVYA